MKTHVVDASVNLGKKTEVAKIRLGAGVPSRDDEYYIRQAIWNNPNSIFQELAETFNVYWTTIEQRLVQLGST